MKLSKNLFCFILFNITTQVMANTAVVNSKSKISKAKISTVKEIVQSLMPMVGSKLKSNSKSKFSVEKCAIDKKKWVMLLVAKQSFTEKISFKKLCDIQGQYTTKMGSAFPVDFKFKNVDLFNKSKFKMLIQFKYDPVPLISIDLLDGQLDGKSDKVLFSATYSAEIDPFSKKFIKKDLGGSVYIKSINGKKINKKYPFPKK